MAVMYSRLGRCLGVTTKLGPLASNDLWAWVKCLLDKLMIHLGLGFSKEFPLGDHQGLLTLLECLLVWEAWRRVVLAPWELVLYVWGEMLDAWASALTALELPVWGGTALTPWELVLSAWELPVWGEEWLPEKHSLPRNYLPRGHRCWPPVDQCSLPGGRVRADCLRANCLGTTCLGEEVLAAWEVLSDQELAVMGTEELTAWGSVLSAWG